MAKPDVKNWGNLQQRKQKNDIVVIILQSPCLLCNEPAQQKLRGYSQCPICTLRSLKRDPGLSLGFFQAGCIGIYTGHCQWAGYVGVKVPNERQETRVVSLFKLQRVRFSRNGTHSGYHSWKMGSRSRLHLSFRIRSTQGGVFGGKGCPKRKDAHSKFAKC